MSYCRMGADSDVYVIDSMFGGFECSCGPTWITTLRSEMYEHLMLHRFVGDRVPQYALNRLREEINTVGDEWSPCLDLRCPLCLHKPHWPHRCIKKRCLCKPPDL